MRSLRRNKRKAAALVLVAAAVAAAGAGIFCLVRLSSFGAFCEKLAKSSLSNNPVKLHYTLADPQSAGYGGLSRDLYAFDPDSYGSDAEVWQSYLEKLARYDPEKLSGEEAFTWEILYRYFALEEELSAYLYYDTPLSPADGTHIQMPVLLAEYRFYDREDVENYLTLLSQLPDYFEGLLTYTEMQAQAGMLQYEGNLEKAAEQCESILTAGELAAGTHFLQTTFAERLKEVAGITEEELEAWTEENNRLLAQLAEAYAKLAAGLREIEGTEELAGLSSYPGGAAYYALLLKEATGSDKSVEEMKAVLYARFEELYAEYREVVMSGNIITDYTFPLENEADMLRDLYQRMQADFPLALTGAALSSVSWTVTLKPVEEGLEDMMAPAFYLTPPVDLNGENTIYINLSDGYEGLTLYTTLAHEGFPGHLYQTVYSQNALTENEAPFIRQILYFGGYTEGWGIYAESYAYGYAAELLEELYGDLYSDTVRAAQLNRELQLCLCSILDIFIHYDGATLSQVQKLLESLGFGSGNLTAVYETICNTPGNYPKYYLGYLEILECKALACEFNAELTDADFHQWLLSAGPADFASLQAKLRRDF